MGNYIVTARCLATLTEEWRITSPHPLTDDEIAAVLLDNAELPEGVELTCLEEQTGGEHDREITEIRGEG